MSARNYVNRQLGYCCLCKNSKWRPLPSRAKTCSRTDHAAHRWTNTATDTIPGNKGHLQLAASWHSILQKAR